MREGFTASLLTEIRLRSNEFRDLTVDTVYLGGGTPSLMSLSDLGLIIGAIREHFKVSPGAEITMEANPDDIEGIPSEAFDMLGINRVSLGVQSFHDDDLKYLNRTHDARTALLAVGKLVTSGISNLNIDLIYGIPGLSEAKWEENLGIAGSFGIPHLSAYWLTVEPGTGLDRLIRRNRLPGPDEEEGLRHFRYLQEWADENGYVQYEISNLSKPGCQSRHNTSYWNGELYLGLGPSAHSYDGTHRMWNVSSLAEYREKLATGLLPSEQELLTPQMRYCEYVMTALRIAGGIDLAHMPGHFGEIASHYCREAALPYQSSGDLIRDGERLYLSRKGMVLADRITSDLFIDPEEWEQLHGPNPATD